MLLQDPTSGTKHVHLKTIAQKTADLSRMVIIKDDWEELFTAVLNAANKDILPKKFRLVDVGFTV
jgi:hypothetical protein